MRLRFPYRTLLLRMTMSVVFIVCGFVVAQDTLRVAINEPSQFDPAFIVSESEALITRSIYDCLIDVDTNNNVIPSLATSWEVSEDGMTYTFNLVEEATFHDGTPLTAEDVVWTFNRLRDPEVGSPALPQLTNVVDVTAFNDSTVQFTLTEVDPFFLYDVAVSRALIVKADTQDFNGFNGTGPFIVTDYNPGDRMSLVANDNYFKEGQPGVDALELIFFSDQVAAVEALRGGQVDIVLEMSVALFESLANVPGITTVSVPTNAFDMVRLRADRAPGDDPRVVEALKLAVDRQAIFDFVKNGIGALGLDNPIGPLYSRYHADDLTPPARDVERARALLAEAGYSDGLPLTLHTPDTGDRPDLAAVLQQQLNEAGFDIDIAIEPESVYYGTDGWLEVTFGITGWSSRPAPQYYFDVAFACDARWNEMRYCNESLDELAQFASTTLDEEARVAAYREIQAMLLAEAPMIIPYFSAAVAAHSDNVSGFDLQAYWGRTNLAAITLE